MRLHVGIVIRDAVQILVGDSHSHWTDVLLSAHDLEIRLAPRFARLGEFRVRVVWFLRNWTFPIQILPMGPVPRPFPFFFVQTLQIQILFNTEQAIFLLIPVSLLAAIAPFAQ